jgi:hypothetical protein
MRQGKPSPSELRSRAPVLSGNERDFDPILAAARNSRFVLIGEASLGTV